MKTLKFGSDFSGIGAPELALKNLNIPIKKIFACEIDKFARKSFTAIHGDEGVFYNDITNRDHAEVEKLDLYVAGFPCQAFSMEGSRKGFDDVRGTLFFNVAEFIKTNQPETFILENVKGLISHDSGKTFQTILSLLSDGGGTVNKQIFIPYFTDGLGYHIYYTVLNTKDFEIPQNRERVFIVGFKKFRNFSFPVPIISKLKLKNFLQINIDKKYFLLDKVIKTITKDGINKDYILIKTNNKNIFEIANEGDCIDFEHPNSTTRRGRVKKQICHTLKTSMNICVFLSGKIRKLTPLECFRLQGFDDESFFRAQKVNSDTQLYKQAGNSITVNVLMEIFKKIYQ